MYSSPPPPDPYPPAYGPSGGAADRPRYAAPVPPRPRDRLPTIRIPKPTLPQWLLLVGGALIVIGAFFPWSSISLGLAAQAKTISITGWQSAFGKATAVFGLAALALALAQLARLQVPRLFQEHARTLYLLCGVEALLVTVLYLLDGERVVTVGTYAAASAGLGLYLALIGAGSIVLGSLSLQRNSSWLL
jgi:hypothetical protein